jgi:hypothetical protein
VDDQPESITAAAFIDQPRDPGLAMLYAYWQQKRGDRLMPARADIDPADFRKLLPFVVLYNVEGLGGLYTFRLVGGAVVQFVGRNFTGMPAGSEMEPTAAAAMTRLLDLVVTSRAPKFRIGRAFWWREKDYRALRGGIHAARRRRPDRRYDLRRHEVRRALGRRPGLTK